jgi:uncharacterized protein YfdQ (DUF2303 family)
MSTDQPRTGEDAVIEITRQSTAPALVEPGQYAVFHTPTGIKEVNLTGDQYRDAPRFKTGTIVVANVDSFATYYAKHSDTGTEVYADLDAGRVTAILDAHTSDGPRWAKHRLILELTPTKPWQRWTGKDRTALPQVQFADFLEDNLVDIDPDPVPAATMLQVATTFQAATKGSFSSKVNMASGSRQLLFEEETTASSGGGKQQIAVPEKFAIRIAPFADTDRYRIEARLRYRIESTGLKLFFVLDRPEDSLRDAVKDVVEQVKAATGATIMLGTPA